MGWGEVVLNTGQLDPGSNLPIHHLETVPSFGVLFFETGSHHVILGVLELTL